MLDISYLRKSRASQKTQKAFQATAQRSRSTLSHVLNTLWLKERYIKTRDGRLRYRCKAVACATVCLTVFSVMPKMMNLQVGASVGGQALASLSAPQSGQPFEMAMATTNSTEQTSAEALPQSKPVEKKLVPQDMVIEIQSGDTLAGSLQSAGVQPAEAYKVVKAVSEYFDPRLIRAGQEVVVKMDPVDDQMQFTELELSSDPIRTVMVKREKDGDIKSFVHEKEIKPELFAVRTEVKHSLYGSATKQGVPDPIVAEAIKILSWSVDLQREIKSGDTFEVLYDVYMTDDGQYVRSGDPYYVKLSQASGDTAFYRHEAKDGNVSYFSKDGKGAKKGLLSTPIDGARMSSGFGMRKHPVLGYSKMHKGVDFAAPTGTPIYAAGDGVVEKASRFSSYGNYVRIRHNSGIKTAYAHLNGYAKGMQQGKRVKQGDIIGYVGTTGRSTGPHLHYEVLVAGKATDPRSVNVPTSEELSGEELKRFKANVEQFEKQFKQGVEGMEFASSSTRKRNL